MRRVAIKVAVGVFFLLAGAAWAGGVEPLTCALRALGGAAAIYVLVTIVGRIIVEMMVRTILNGPASSTDRSEAAPGEHGNRRNG